MTENQSTNPDAETNRVPGEGKPPRRMGRPPGRKFTVKKNIFLTPSQADALAEGANKAEQTESAYLRDALEAWHRRTQRRSKIELVRDKLTF